LLENVVLGAGSVDGAQLVTSDASAGFSSGGTPAAVVLSNHVSSALGGGQN
jgi:hypothetical protein